MPAQVIKIVGARQHNLKNLSLEIPREKLVVITGLSGSGKSSLAFDTLYAEGQRRYVESLSAYARQFLELMEKPDVDLIEGLSPAIAIEQKAASHNPRSTVGTVTEIHDYLRLLFARPGTPARRPAATTHCPSSSRGSSRSTTRWAPARAATGSGRSNSSMPGASSRTLTCRSRAARSAAGTGATISITRCCNRSRGITA